MARSVVSMAMLVGGQAGGATLDEARALHGAGASSEALTAYQAVIAAPGTSPEDVATAHNNRCVLLNNLGRLAEALSDCREALGRREALGNRRGLARTSNNHGLVLQNLGEFAAARQAYRRALALNVELNDAPARAVNLGNLGTLAILSGDYSAAMEAFDAVARLADAAAGEGWAAAQRHLARLNRGVALERLGAYREALDAYLGVLADSATLDERQRAALTVNVGVVYRNLGDPVTAMRRFEEAAATYERLDDLAGLANVRLNIGLVQHLNMNDRQAADAELRSALALAGRAGDVPGQMQVKVSLGALLLERSKLREAADLYAACLALAGEAGSPEGRWSALFGLGRVAAAEGDGDRALALFREAVEVLESTRRGLTTQRLRQDYFGDKRAVYEAIVGLLGDRHRVDATAGHHREALAYVQRSKARELTDALRRDREAAGLVPAAGSDVAVPTDEAVLEYYFAGERLFLWIIDSADVRMRVIDGAAAVRDAVNAVYRNLSRGVQADEARVEGLSQALLGGASEALGRSRTLRIAPDGALHYLPFELLRRPGGDLLVDGHVVSYLPSSSVLASVLEQAGRAATADVMLAGFGAGIDAGAAPYVLASAADRLALEPLPRVRDELAALDRLLPGRHDIYAGADATERTFREAVAAGARIVHLAGHTIVDESREQGAAIVLTAADGDDGLLFPREIAGTNLRASLTVLAACRTAFSGEPSGRQFSTLTGSLLAAGSSAVVATLWDVGDETTAAYMEQFYYRLSRGMAPGDALRDTKIALREQPEWRATGAWSAYVLVGASEPLVVRTSANALLAAAGLILAMAWLYLRRRTAPGDGGLTGP